MKIAVIAANGRSGRAFVAAALDAGHEVVAGIHGKDTLPTHPRLVKMQCDARNAIEVKNCIETSDAVVSLIGHVRKSPPRVQTEAMTTIVQVMKALGVRRIISLTGTGVRYKGDKIPLVDYAANFAISLIDPNRVNDGKEHAALLQRSGLDWTLVRVLKLQNTKPSIFSLKSHGPTKWFVSREDVAAAILQVLEENSFIAEAPILSK